VIEEKMKVKIKQVLKNLDGTPRFHEGNELTLRFVMIEALALPLTNVQLSGLEKVRRATIATEIYKAENEIDLKIEDVAMIKDLIGIHFAPLIVKGAWEILDKEV
jgi:hypothetical protein